jgi:hypothetical protein
MLDKQLRDLLEHTIYILQHPQASPRETVLLAGMAVVLLLAILSFFSLFFIGKPKSAEEGEEAAKRVPRRMSIATDLVILGGAFLIAVVVTLGVFAHVSRQPSYCRSCHEMSRDHRSWERSTHRSVECANCHQDPGAFGYVLFKVRQLDMVLARLSRGYEKPITANVSNASCLQCHRRGIRDSLVVSGLRVRHRDILAAGYKCVQCHNTAGHGGAVVRPIRPSMDQCSACHNGKRASAACSGCHVVDIGRSVSAQSGNNYPAVRLGKTTTCRGCHSVASCNKCHGLELPHPTDWLSGLTHAPAGAFERREQLCSKCHSDIYCNQCHKLPGHGLNWKAEHGVGGPYKQEGCLGCHVRVANLCGICHKQYADIKVKLPKGRYQEPQVPKGAKTF